MPYTRHHLPEHNLLLTRAFGVITDEDVMDHVRAVDEAHAQWDDLLELGDTEGLEARGMTSLTMGVIFRAGKIEAGRKSQKSKLAIVAHNPLVYGFARAYTTVVSGNRAGADAFRSIDEALEWLGLAPHREEILAFIDEAARKDREAHPD